MDQYNNKDSDVLGPPPSYDSVVYGTDSAAAASGILQTGTNIPPPPGAYPIQPNTYPVNPAYPQYPIPYNVSQPPTSIVQPTTIVCANQQPQSSNGSRRAIIISVCFVFFFIVIIIAWNFSSH